MAEKDPKKLIKESKEEAAAMLDALQSITDTIIQSLNDIANGFDTANRSVDIISKTMQRGVVAELKQAVKNQEEIVKLQAQASKGEAKATDIAKLKAKILGNQALAAAKLESLQRNTAGLSKKELEILKKKTKELQAYLAAQEEELEKVETINDEKKVEKGLAAGIADNAKKYLQKIDKSGVAAALMNKNLSKTSKFLALAEIAMAALLDSAFQASQNIADIRKETGIGYTNAMALQAEFALIATDSGKAWANSIQLNKSFRALTESTGIVRKYTGDTLVTMTGLTKQMGLEVEAATQITMLASMQSKDTESVLNNVDKTVNSLNKQNKTSISLKQIYKDIGGANKALVVSLKRSNEELAKAAMEARALGTNLEGAEKIADSLVNFESSLEAELQAELLLGKQINLERAREAALSNDTAEMMKAIKEDAGLLQIFAGKNRIQQEAAAKVYGLTRGEMAEMVYQTDLLNSAQEEGNELAEEQTHQSLETQSAAERIADSMESFKSILADIGLIFAPIVDGFSFIVELITSSKIALGIVAGIMGTIAGYQSVMLAKAAKEKLQSIGTAVAEIWKSAAKGGFGWGTVALGVAGVAGLMGSLAAVQSVKDGIAPSSKGPFTITDAYGATAITAKGDSLAVSPNVRKGGDDSRMLAVLNKIANKDSNVYMDSQKVGTSMAMGYNSI